MNGSPSRRLYDKSTKRMPHPGSWAICRVVGPGRRRVPLATMNVSLPQPLAAFVEAEVASGAYGTASEVVQDALRLLQRARAAREEKMAVLVREVGRGLEQAGAGRLSPRTIRDIANAVAAEEDGGEAS